MEDKAGIADGSGKKTLFDDGRHDFNAGYTYGLASTSWGGRRDSGFGYAMTVKMTGQEISRRY